MLGYKSGKFQSHSEQAEEFLIAKQLRNILFALSQALVKRMSLMQPLNSSESDCSSMMNSDRLNARSVTCLLVDLPMAVFERDTIFRDGKRYIPASQRALIVNCTERTVAGRFVISMISTLSLLHQRVFIDLPQLDVALNRAAAFSDTIILSSFAPSSDFRIGNPNVMFPLNLQQSALRHSVEGLLFYSYGHYTRPPAHITSLYLNNVFEWNCIEYSPFSRDPDSFCRSLVAGEISKRGYSVYNIDPDSVFLQDISRVKGHYGHLAMTNYYFNNEEMWLNFSTHVGRMNNFGQWFLESRSPFSVAWSFFIHLLATDFLTTTNPELDSSVDEVLMRYATSKTSDRYDIAVIGQNTQCGDDQHVFNDFFQFFAQESSARFLRRVFRRDESVVVESSTAFLEFRILTGREYAMAVSFCRGAALSDTVTVHLTTYGHRQHKPTCLREQGAWYMDSLDDMSWFKGRFIAFDDDWFGKLVTRFHENEASQVE
jgi:hypothetical protein